MRNNVAPAVQHAEKIKSCGEADRTSFYRLWRIRTRKIVLAWGEKGAPDENNMLRGASRTIPSAEGTRKKRGVTMYDKNLRPRKISSTILRTGVHPPGKDGTSITRKETNRNNRMKNSMYPNYLVNRLASSTTELPFVAPSSRCGFLACCFRWQSRTERMPTKPRRKQKTFWEAAAVCRAGNLNRCPVTCLGASYLFCHLLKALDDRPRFYCNGWSKLARFSASGLLKHFIQRCWYETDISMEDMSVITEGITYAKNTEAGTVVYNYCCNLMIMFCSCSCLRLYSLSHHLQERGHDSDSTVGPGNFYSHRRCTSYVYFWSICFFGLFWYIFSLLLVNWLLL